MKPIAFGLVLAASIYSLQALAAEPSGPADLITRTEAVRIKIQGRLGDLATSGTDAQVALAEYYALPDQSLLWVDENGISDRGKMAMAEIAKADDYGLRASDYSLPDAGGYNRSSPGATEWLADAEIKISRAVLAYARDARGGRLDPQSLNKNLDPTLTLPNPSEVLGSIAYRSDPAAYLRSFQPSHPQFEALRKLLIAARNGEEAPAPAAPDVVVLPDGPLLKVGVKHPQVTLLRKRLDIPVKAGADETVYDQDVFAAVQQFQRSNGAYADGIVGPGTRRMLNGGKAAPRHVDGQEKIDLLLVNMERWRWLPHDLGAFYVTVNIPEFMLRIVEDGKPIHETRVVVGKTNKQTPIFSDEMEEIVFRPNWYVPNSIKTEEIAPYLYRGGGGFFGGGWDTSIFQRYDLRIRGVNGRDIDPNSIDWGRSDIRRYELYQPPGPRNVLGMMKFRFPNSHDVYLHDTTQKNLFAKSVRTESHGCMRVQYPDQVATLLLGHDQGWTAARVASAVNGVDDNHITLNKHIPVYITYFTAVVGEDGSLSTYRDVYGHDRRMIAALQGRSVPYDLPGNEEAVASDTPPAPVYRRSRNSGGNDPFGSFARSLFDF